MCIHVVLLLPEALAVRLDPKLFDAAEVSDIGRALIALAVVNGLRVSPGLDVSYVGEVSSAIKVRVVR